MDRVCGPNTRDWLAAGAIVTEGVCERASLVVLRGEPPVALVPAGLACSALEKEVGALLPELARRAHGELAFMAEVAGLVALVAQAVS